MSLRLLTTKLVKHGRYFLQAFWKRDIYTNILEQQHKTRPRLTAPSQTYKATVNVASKQNLAKNALKTAIGTGGQTSLSSRQANGIFRFGQHARKLFIDNLLNRCTTTYSAPLRSEATKKLFYGDSAPFFALIGVSLASGAGVLTKEDELEGVCFEIREAASRLQQSWNYDEISETLNSDFNIDKLDIGPAIAKGCAAVVYAAAFKNNFNVAKDSTEKNIEIPKMETTDDLLSEGHKDEVGDGLHNSIQQQYHSRPEFMTPIQNMSRFVHNFGSSVDNLQVYNQSAAAAELLDALDNINKNKEDQDSKQQEESIQRLSNVVGASGLKDRMQEMESLNPSTDLTRYPLALKMMFNYDIQSNALSILRAMYKETVPARQRYINPSAENWERLIQDQTLILPPHPNIVAMFGFFCDEVKSFPDGHLLYPIAQPQRINPNGYGRNMSLYLLMKRYDYSLRNLLDSQELSTRTKVLLFAQLLEAVAHINRHGIAHRDLKSDNILIEMNDDESPPVLVVSDFGCCSADKVHGLRIPYASYDIDKGGNAALMAPEIINKQPGAFAVLNYSKADLWACGAIAYEIFGHRNPFYTLTFTEDKKSLLSKEQVQALKNSDYKSEDLPPLNDSCPELVQHLIYNILNPNPSKRVSPDIAANIMQLYLWAPSKWLKSGEMPNSPEILQWLLTLTTKIMCEGRTFSNMAVGLPDQLSFSQYGRRTYVEYLLICSFLARAHLRRIRGALNWIQNTIESY